MSDVHVNHPAVGGTDDDILAAGGRPVGVPEEHDQQAGQGGQQGGAPHRQGSGDRGERQPPAGTGERDRDKHRYGEQVHAGTQDA